MSGHPAIGPISYPPHLSVTTPWEDPRGWGREVIVINCADYCGKLLCFNEGAEASMHYHDRKHETWYVLEGEIMLRYIDTDDATPKARQLGPGDVVDIPRLCPHQVKALTKARIMEVSTPHYHEDSYRIAKGDSQRAKEGST